MRFRQLDRILELRPGVEITAQRTLSDRDTLFRDHFPRFPVLPGVLTLEAMFQACEWLVRRTADFSISVVLLKEVRNLKFAGFVRPGQTLTVEANVRKYDDETARFVTRVVVDDQVVASSRLALEWFRLADRYPARAATDSYLALRKLRQYESIGPHAPGTDPVRPTGYRWMWLDRFTKFVSGQRAEAIKTVSLTDEPLDLYMPGFPVMPCSLITEGLAQTGGILVSDYRDFDEPVVLAKIGKAVFHRPALPGDTMTYATEIADVQPEGAIVRGTSRIDGELHAEFDLTFAYLKDRLGEFEPIPPSDVLKMLRLYGLYDVAETDSGKPLAVPPRLLDAERRLLASMRAGQPDPDDVARVSQTNQEGAG
jgi:3-hydroxyacyl-[acyl-carrier-protein] dehydratase